MHLNLAVSMKYLTDGSAQLLTQLKCIKYTVRIDAEDIVRLRSCFLCRLQKAFLPYQPVCWVPTYICTCVVERWQVHERATELFSFIRCAPRLLLSNICYKYVHFL